MAVLKRDQVSEMPAALVSVRKKIAKSKAVTWHHPFHMLHLRAYIECITCPIPFLAAKGLLESLESSPIRDPATDHPLTSKEIRMYNVH